VSGSRGIRWLLGVALAAVAIGIPFMFGPYPVGQFTTVLAFAVAVLGLNVLVGYSGQISLGHGAFFALGAYAAAILIGKEGFPHLLALPVAAVIGFVAGLLFGLPALRVRGVYLALLTLGLAVATPPLIKRFDTLTEGSQGINVLQPEAPSGLGLDTDQWSYFIALAVAVPMFLLVANLLRGRVGRALTAIRDRELVARSLGVDVARFKTLAFAVSAAYAAVGGVLYVYAVGFVSPESFPLLISISFLAAVVVGGLATVTGALLGAAFIVFVPEYAGDVDDALAGVIYGAVIIALMYLEPGGAMGIVRRVKGRLRGRQREGPLAGARVEQGGSDAVDGQVAGGGARRAVRDGVRT
jgi:branched-chain amino acid transport system permease protein